MQDNNRTPKLHATTHKRNGSDEILLDEFGVPRDVTLLNSTPLYHGLFPKLLDVTNKFMRSDGTWSDLPPSGGGSTDNFAWHITGDTIGADKILGSLDASGGYSVKFFVENQELMRMVDDGDHLQWTGPRLKVGHTGDAFYPNGDIISIKKTVGDQLSVTIQNPHNNASDPSGCGFTCINNDGTKTGGVQIFNDDWPTNGDGVNPGEYACIAFGGPAVYGTQTTEDVRFIANKVQWAHYDQSANIFSVEASELLLTAGNLQLDTGYIKATAAGAVLTIGDAGDPTAGGGIKAGVSGQYSFSFQYDSINGYTGIVVHGKAATFARNDLVSGAASGSGYGAWERLINADGKALSFMMSESGASTDYLEKANFATISVPAGIGIRVNVNGTNDSGFSIGTDQTMHQYGTFQSYNLMPEGGDGVGSVGDNSHRWSLIRGVTITSGDLNLEDDDFGSKWTIREAKEAGEDVDALYAINRRTGQKFKVQLAVA